MDRNEELKRLENVENEKFYFVLFQGTLMPNNTKFHKLLVFEETLIEETEENRRENLYDYFFIQAVIDTISRNLNNIEKLANLKGEPVKNSFKNEFKLKINNKTISANRNLLNDEGRKIYDAFIQDIYNALDVPNKK